MYQYIDETNSNLGVNTDTGEVMEVVTMILPIGSTVYTPEQKRAFKEWQNQTAKREYRRQAQSELGYFYFILSEYRFGKLSAETVTRLIYLCTFLNYNGEFMKTQRQHMKKSDLQNVLGLSKGSVFNFCKEVIPNYIVDNGNDGLVLNCSEIIRGKLTNSENQYKKFYIKAIQTIYQATPVSRHKHLGYVFQLLPYINNEYNIICSNPYEPELNKIEPLSVAEICDLIGYEKSNICKLMKIYQNITFEYKNQQEYFLTFVTNKVEAESRRCFVNPHILYSGSNFQKVEVLGAFVKV